MSLLTTISNYITKIGIWRGEWSFRFKNKKIGGVKAGEGSGQIRIILGDIKTVDWVLSILHKHNSRCSYCNRRIRPKSFGVMTNDKVVCNNICCLIQYHEETKNK